MKWVPGPVMQDWLFALTLKEQTVLLLSLRGSDIGATVEVKSLTRWIRSIVLRNAAPDKTFMKRTYFGRIIDMAEANPPAFDMLSVHVFGHLMHAFEIIGYKHPDTVVRAKALQAYLDLCEYMHVNPETEVEMSARLSDEV